MQRAIWKIGIPLLLFGLLVLGFSVSGAFAASPLPVSYNPTPVVVQNNSSSGSTTSTTSGTTTTQSGGTTTTGTTTTGTTTPTASQPSPVVNNSTASPLPVSYTPTPVVYTSPTTPTTTTGTTGTTVTPTPVNTSGLTADEATLVDLINEDRADYGVSTVTVNMTATEAATAKVQDMITNDYFGHDSPTYGMPSQMLTEFGVTYTVTGENIAEVANVEVANSDFMSDSGHSAIILDPSFTQVGVGVIPYNGYEVVVEEFIG